jgi:protein SCO1/2
MTTPSDGAGDPRRRQLAYAGLCVLVAGLALLAIIVTNTNWFGSASGPPGIAIGGPFQLVDQDNKPISDKDFLGKPTAIFFGYTNCPDACPTTLMDMSDRLKALGPDGDKFNVLFISLDPQRDTPALLKSYLESFDPRIRAATGTEAEVKDVAQKFRVYYKKVGDGDSYTFDHSTAVYLMDAKGQLVTLIDYKETQDVALDKMRRALKS